jgi:hypothetical protein
MINIEKIEEKIAKIAEAGLELPCFAYISIRSMQSMFSVYYPSRRDTGFSYCTIYTSFGRLTVFAMMSLSDDDVILCSNYNIILDILSKLDFERSTLY